MKEAPGTFKEPEDQGIFCEINSSKANKQTGHKREGQGRRVALQGVLQSHGS